MRLEEEERLRLLELEREAEIEFDEPSSEDLNFVRRNMGQYADDDMQISGSGRDIESERTRT